MTTYSPSLTYFHLPPNSAFPDISSLAPCRALVIVRAQVSAEWRHQASDWLVKSGCFYVCAWGNECSLWDDAVDAAHIEFIHPHNLEEQPIVMTSWHDDETVEEAMHFCKHMAHHDEVDIKNTVLIEIDGRENEIQTLEMYFRILRR